AIPGRVDPMAHNAQRLGKDLANLLFVIYHQYSVRIKSHLNFLGQLQRRIPASGNPRGLHFTGLRRLTPEHGSSPFHHRTKMNFTKNPIALTFRTIHDSRTAETSISSEPFTYPDTGNPGLLLWFRLAEPGHFYKRFSLVLSYPTAFFIAFESSGCL